ncbi:hypothetical protein BJV82DRAFT_635125 [Fennellomyces sp. T-0311]|nr:hypothetical protein BJV82DRAFT_635125 [Fennellomyces sp. T-0311]
MQQVVEGSPVPSSSPPIPVTSAQSNFLASLAPAPAPLSTLFSDSNPNAMDIDIAASIFPATPSSPLSFSPSFPMSIDIMPKVTPALTPAESPRKEDSAPLIVPAKRGYKSHVPSACVNCKKAHLACDVSRPCKRCVSLGKTDTCQDIKHKKRGRPRLRDKQAPDGRSNDSGYEVMYGTIQTPSFATQQQHAPPPRSVAPQTSMAATNAPPTTTISFIHEPIESFQQQPQEHANPLHQTPTSNGTFIQQPVQLIPQIPFDEFLHDSNTIMQQYMVPPYMTMPMQQSFNQQQPQAHEHVPETMSLQMKMGNAFAQRPTSLPLAPPTSPSRQQQQRPQPRPQPQQQPHQATQNDSNGRQRLEKSPQSSSPVNDRRLSDDDSGNSSLAVTFILSMEVCCARVSEEVTEMWGYYPQEFAHRSLYDFISPKDTDRLARLHRLLLDNIVDVAKRHEPPPQTERTTSEVFHKMDQEQLTAIAPGSCTFSDTLHVKKRSGEEELYEMMVCMGGGLGADLHKTDSHSKLYIIAQFRKHRYEVSAQNPFEPAPTSRLVSSSFSQTGSSKAQAPANTNSNKSTNSGLKKPFSKTNPPFRHTMARTITDIGRMGPDMRSRSALPAHYATSSQLSTISKIEPAKVNVAPITQQRSSPSFSTSLASSWQNRLGKSSFTAHNSDKRRNPTANSSTDSDTSSSSSSSSFAPSTSTTFVSAPLSSARESQYSTLAYRFAPLPPTKMTTGSPRGGPNVTHPTTQYFLQTSSSTLNAAASAAQYSSRNKYHSTSSMADNDKASGKTDSNRKVEMSIRSLLC